MLLTENNSLYRRKKAEGKREREGEVSVLGGVDIKKESFHQSGMVLTAPLHAVLLQIEGCSLFFPHKRHLF